MGIDWGYAGAVVISGLIVVFAILLLLVLLCVLLGVAVKRSKGKKSDLNKTQVKNEKSKPSESIQKAVAAPAADTGITDEIVSAISAAVACVIGQGKPFVIRSVKRVARGRNVWNAAGIAENTRPF